MKFGRLTVAGYAVGLAVGVGAVLTYGAMEVSGTPGFCGTCHVMTPYFESWKTSSHAEIACVDCHIPPGITATLEKKYEALAMVARYFTGTYGTNPWAEIDDAACLECHQRRLLSGTELFGDILFDHGPHLSELRRGKRLRCTSCHSQMVQGGHISVTATTCTLCHFKDQKAGEGTAQCKICHQTPTQVVDAQGLAFDHSDVERFGMDCLACHDPPAADAGGVPRERCLTCHNREDRLAEYEETEFLHLAHVTDHKVECTNCHLEIEHVSRKHVEAAQSGCEACHGSGHSPQRDLYAGIGGKGVEPMPDVMFRAGVRCEGCHLDQDEESETRTAGEISCMSCHGPEYRGLFAGWQQIVASRTTALRRQFNSTRRLLGDAPPDDFYDARSNLELVERGHGIHNVQYSLALLAAAHRQLNEARGERGAGRLELPWSQAPFESPCLECHAGAEVVVGRVFGRSFPHQPHVVGAETECQTCHTTHEERDAGAEALKLDSGSCNSCHHSSAEASSCVSCHGDLSSRTIPVELGNFPHSAHVDDMEMECSLCHGEPPALRGSPDRTVCADCH